MFINLILVLFYSLNLFSQDNKADFISLSNQLEILGKIAHQEKNVEKLTFEEAKKVFQDISSKDELTSQELLQKNFLQLKNAFIEHSNQTKDVYYLKELITFLAVQDLISPAFFDNLIKDKDIKELMGAIFKNVTSKYDDLELMKKLEDELDSIFYQNIISYGFNDRAMAFKMFLNEFKELMFQELNKLKKSSFSRYIFSLSFDILKFLDHLATKKINTDNKQILLINGKEFSNLKNELTQFLEKNKSSTLLWGEFQWFLRELKELSNNIPENIDQIKIILPFILNYYISGLQKLSNNLDKNKNAGKLREVLKQKDDIDDFIYKFRDNENFKNYPLFIALDKADMYFANKVFDNFALYEDIILILNQILDATQIPNADYDKLLYMLDNIDDISLLKRKLGKKLNTFKDYLTLEAFIEKLRTIILLSKFSKNEAPKQEKITTVPIETKIFKQFVNELIKNKTDEFDVYTVITPEENKSGDNQTLNIEALRIFGFDPSKMIGKEVLRKRFRKLSIIFHPDKYKDDRRLAENIFKAINRANEILK